MIINLQNFGLLIKTLSTWWQSKKAIHHWFGLVAMAITLPLLSSCGAIDSAAGVSLQIAPDARTASYSSPQISADKFNAWFIHFVEQGVGEAQLSVRFRLAADGSWSDWQEVTLDQHDAEDFAEIEQAPTPEVDSGTTLVVRDQSAFVLTTPATAYAWRVELLGEPGFGVRDFVLETEDTSARARQMLIPQASAQLADLQVISRDSWKANPDYLLYNEKLDSTATQTSPAWSAREQKCADLQTAKPAEFRTDSRKISTDSGGRRLQWPQTYSTRIEKILLHHTDTEGVGVRDLDGDGNYTPADAAAIVRAIYHYHAVSRGWGDIGYHFLVDSFGNVYEGRAGGEGVIGAHAYCANTGTIAVAVLGDFTESAPPAVALDSVVALVGELANLYGVDPAGSSDWHGKLTENLVGHRDYGSTQCPGAALYAALPDLRARASTYAREQFARDAAEAKSETRSSETVAVAEDKTPRLTGDLVTAKNTLELKPGESGQITIAYKNNGNQTWRKEDVVLQRLPAEPSQLYQRSSWVSPVQPGTMRNWVVEPGQTAYFDISVAYSATPITEEFVPMVRGRGRIRGPAAIIAVGNIENKKQSAGLGGGPEGNRTPNDMVPTQSSTPVTGPSSTRPANEILTNEKSLPKEANSIGDSPQTGAKTTELVQSQFTNSEAKDQGPAFRVKLGFQSDRIEIGGGELRLIGSNQSELFRGSFVDFTKSKLKEGEYYQIEPLGSTILKIANWAHHPGWTKEVNDNQFRGKLEVRKYNGELIVINELPLEQYLRGVAEPLPSDPEQKAQLLAVLARSYALYYTDPTHRKFPGAPYDGSDNPAEFQKYLGYSYELRGNMPAAVEATRGLAVHHQGKVVKTPYFTSSSGRTRTAAEAKWNTADFAFTKSVSDPWSCGLNSQAIGTKFSCPEQARGHGVGVSGTGATGLAKEGKSYRQIIDYFFEGVEVQQAY